MSSAGTEYLRSEGGNKNKFGRLITWSGVPGSSYIAEGVSPVAGRVDVARGGWAVAVGSRGVRDDGGLAGVTGADPQSSCGGRRRACEWAKRRHLVYLSMRLCRPLPCLSAGCEWYRVCWLCLIAAVRGRSACITHSWLPFTTGSDGIAREWRFGTSLLRVARDCFAWGTKTTHTNTPFCRSNHKNHIKLGLNFWDHESKCLDFFNLVTKFFLLQMMTSQYRFQFFFL